MLSKGPAKRVTIFVNEDIHHGSQPLWRAVFDFLLHKQAAGASLTRPTMGFGSHNQLHSSDTEASMRHLPVRIEFIDSPARVEELLPTLYDMVNDGIIDVQETTVVKATQAGGKPRETRPPAHSRQAGPARLMRIFLGESDKWRGEPLYDAIVKRLRMEDIAGATVYRAILGYGAKGHTHKGQSFLHPARDNSIMITVIDTEEKIRRAVSIVSDMLLDGLIVLSDAEIIRFARSTPSEEASDAGTTTR